MPKPLVLMFCGGLLVGSAISQVTLLTPAQSQEQTKQASAESKELEVLKSTAEAFEKAYNAADAKAIAAQFTENAEVVDDEGNVTKGRVEIEARFASLFKEFPKARISVELTSLRQLGPDVAIEDGYSTTTLDPDEPGSRSPYTLVHLKKDGKWLVASIRDFPEEESEPEFTAHDHLLDLEWLVGDWVDESHEGRVETSGRWSEDGNYLLQDYVVRSRRGSILKGNQRIAWDPVRQSIRSWAFDVSGAFTEATWRRVGESWLLRVEGVTPDGQSVSANRTLTPVNQDAFQIETTSAVVGNELLPDNSVRVVRRPPSPER